MAKIRTGTVVVHGLDDLARALKSLEGGAFTRELQQTNKSVAGTEAKNARSAADSLGGVAAHVAPSLAAVGGARAAGVAFGGAAYPMAGGAEFGGQRRPTTQQFAPWRGSGPDAGYFLYPTIRRDADRIEDDYYDALGAFLKKVDLA